MFFLTKNFERIRSDRTTNLQFSEFFQMFLTCFLFFKLRKYFVLFSPCSHPSSCPCANDDTLKFLFIKKFQFFFSRIEIAFIFVGRIGFERLLCIVKFILQYVLLFSFFLCFAFWKLYHVCPKIILIQSQIHLSSGRSFLPSASQTEILAVTSLW